MLSDKHLRFIILFSLLIKNLKIFYNKIIFRDNTDDWIKIKGPSMPGSSPGGSRVIRRWGRSRRPWRNTFNYRYIQRLETDSVVGKLVEKKRLNNLVYVEYNPCSRWEFSQRNGEQERSDHGGISLSGNWSDFFIFGFAYIPFVTHRDEYRVTRGSAVLTFIKIRCFT